jgi:hypothetical protein
VSGESTVKLVFTSSSKCRDCRDAKSHAALSDFAVETAVMLKVTHSSK